MKKLKFWQMVIISISSRKFKEKYITKLSLKAALEEFIKNGEKAIAYKGGGLCYHVNRFSRDYVRKLKLLDYVSASCIASRVEGLFKELYRQWPEYSGHCYHPIHDKFETYILEDYMSSILCRHTENQEIYIGPVSPRWQYLLNAEKAVYALGMEPEENIMTRCSGVNGLYKGRQLELRLDLAKFVHGEL